MRFLKFSLILNVTNHWSLTVSKTVYFSFIILVKLVIKMVTGQEMAYVHVC